MTELREFARRSEDLEHPPSAWTTSSTLAMFGRRLPRRNSQFRATPGAKVIRRYGLRHQAGHSDNDIALLTMLLIGPDGREKRRRVSVATRSTNISASIPAASGEFISAT